jgi:hypothetical protein
MDDSGRTSLVITSIRDTINRWKGYEFKFEGIDAALDALKLINELTAFLQPAYTPTAEDFRLAEERKQQGLAN